MKKLLLVLLVATLSINCEGQKQKETINTSSEDVVTTYYFIRHAEKDLSNPSSRNPDLTAEGEQRAIAWKTYFDDKNIDVIYSTNFKRTMNTAQPTAIANNLEIITYNPAKLNTSGFKKDTKGKNVVIVGHSNTTAQFANAILKRNEAPEIDESDYGNLYIVTKTNNKITFSKEHFD